MGSPLIPIITPKALFARLLKLAHPAKVTLVVILSDGIKFVLIWSSVPSKSKLVFAPKLPEVSLNIDKVLTDSGKTDRTLNVDQINAVQNNYGMDGNISNMQIYNRALSAQEVKQNYNALKGRFQ